MPSSVGFNSAYSRRKRVYAATYFFHPRVNGRAAKLYFNDFNNAPSYVLSYILAILIVHERIHSCLSELYATPFIFASISTAHFFSPFSSSLALSLLPLPFGLRSRIEINDTLGASAKRDHENRFERSRRKLLDGRLNRPVGSWLANVQAAIAHVQNKYVPRTSG